MSKNTSHKAAEMEIVKKITFKSLVGVPTAADIKEAHKTDQEHLPQKLCVVGICTGLKHTTNNDTGEVYEALSGDFIAYAPGGETKVSSATCYLPPIAHDLIKAKISGQGTAVEFGIEIGVRLPRAGEKSPAGYIYTVKPLIKPEASSPILRLLAKAEGKDEEKEAA